MNKTITKLFAINFYLYAHFEWNKIERINVYCTHFEVQNSIAIVQNVSMQIICFRRKKDEKKNHHFHTQTVFIHSVNSKSFIDAKMTYSRVKHTNGKNIHDTTTKYLFAASFPHKKLSHTSMIQLLYNMHTIHSLLSKEKNQNIK